MTDDPNDPDDIFDPRDLVNPVDGEVNPNLLSERQFTSQDVMRLLGITDKQLEHAIDPKRAVIRLTVHEAARIRGLRRLFSGSDILKIATVFAVNEVGFPMRFMRALGDTVERRAFTLCPRERDLTPDLMIATWPMKSGEDWAVSHLYTGRPDTPKLPIASIVIDVDRLIRETIAKIGALVEDREIPVFESPDPKPEPSPYSPENDFFHAWTKDEQGRNCRVGLTFDETRELEALNEASLDGETFTAKHRRRELATRHERARQKRLGEEAHQSTTPDRPS